MDTFSETGHTNPSSREEGEPQTTARATQRRAALKAAKAAAGGHSRWLQKRREEKATAHWARWMRRHADDPILALAEAVRTLNRAVKVGTSMAPGSAARKPLLSAEDRERAYKVKDEWIGLSQRFLIDGKVARQETFWGGKPSRVLYSHTFNVHGKAFCFHSYQPPIMLSTERGEDLPAYGTLMSVEE